MVGNVISVNLGVSWNPDEECWRHLAELVHPRFGFLDGLAVCFWLPFSISNVDGVAVVNTDIQRYMRREGESSYQVCINVFRAHSQRLELRHIVRRLTQGKGVVGRVVNQEACARRSRIPVRV